MTAFAVIVGTMSTVTAAGSLIVAIRALRQNEKLAEENRTLAAQSDSIQERLAVIEEARRRDELQPVLTMEAEIDNETLETSILTIRNDGRTDLEHTEIVEVAEAPPVIEQGIKSVIGVFHPLRLGQSENMAVARDKEKGGGLLVLRMRVTSSSGEWETAVRCEIPHSFAPKAYFI